MTVVIDLIEGAATRLPSFLRSLRSPALRLLSFLDGKIFIPLLVVVTGQKCTLRCRYCGNFTPCLPQNSYDIDAVCEDFEKMASLARISSVQVQGGEALVCPGLETLLECLGRFPVDIEIATNGTRLLTPGQINALRGAGARLRISDYGVTRQKSAELLTQCEAEGIPAVLYRFAGVHGNWIDMGARKAPARGKSETVEVFRRCPFNRCLTLENGILARCSRATVSHLVQGFFPGPSDLLDMRNLDAEGLRRALTDYLFNPSPMEACRHCNGGTGHAITAGEQIFGE